MRELLRKLDRNAQKGSKPRCHWITYGDRAQVAERLTKVIGLDGCIVTMNDRWLPDGFQNTAEAQLHQAAELLSDDIRKTLCHWWLEVASQSSMTPSLDIASTCLLRRNNREERGLLLVEAKAHEWELIHEEKGKELCPKKTKDGIVHVTINSRTNHVRIRNCMEEASCALSTETGVRWELSNDWNYQMSNRFAWAWKLATLGVPVVVVYLGFLNANEMKDGEFQNPLPSPQDWQQLVLSHSDPLFGRAVWNNDWKVGGKPLIPLIRSMEIPLDRPCKDIEVFGSNGM